MIKSNEMNIIWKKTALSGAIGVVGLMSYLVKKYYFDNQSLNDNNGEDIENQFEWLVCCNKDIDDKMTNVDYQLILKEKNHELKISFHILSKGNNNSLIIIIPASNSIKSVIEGNTIIINDHNLFIDYPTNTNKYIIKIPYSKLSKERNEIIFKLTLLRDLIFPILYYPYPYDNISFSFIKYESKAIRPSFIPHNNNTIESKIIIPSIKYLWLSFESDYKYSHHFDNKKIGLHSNVLIFNPTLKGKLICNVFSFIKTLFNITYQYESFNLIFIPQVDNEVMSYGYGYIKILCDLLETEQLNIQDSIYLNFLIANGVISSFMLNYLHLNNDSKKIMIFEGICIFLTQLFFEENEVIYPNETLFIEELKTKVIDLCELEDSISINDAMLLLSSNNKEKERNEIGSFKIGLLLIYFYSIKDKRIIIMELMKKAIQSKTSFEYLFNKEYEQYFNSKKVPKIKIEIQRNANDDGDFIIISNINHHIDILSLKCSIELYSSQSDWTNIKQQIEITQQITVIPLKTLINNSTLSKPQLILFDNFNHTLSLQEYTTNDIQFLLAISSNKNKVIFINKRSIIAINRNLFHMVKSGMLQSNDYLAIIHNILMNSLENINEYLASILINNMAYIVINYKSITQSVTLLDYFINIYMSLFPNLIDIIVNCIFDIIASNDHINIIMSRNDYIFYNQQRKHSMWHFAIDYPSKDKEELCSKLKADYVNLTSKLSTFYTNDHISCRRDEDNDITHLASQADRIKHLMSLIFALPTMPFLKNQSLIYFLIKDMNNTIKRIEKKYKKETLFLKPISPIIIFNK